jgi:hypothetical protein
MKKILLGIVLLTSTLIRAQDTIQSTMYPYVRLMPIGVYTNPGVTADRITQNIEFGESFKMLDLGLEIGRLSQRPDSTIYIEGKVTMDACQYGIFSNEVLVGAGYNFNSSTPLLLEIGSSIFAQVHEKYGVGVSVSSYSLSGAVNGTNNTFFGLFLRWGLPRTDAGNLLLHRAHGR